MTRWGFMLALKIILTGCQDQHNVPTVTTPLGKIQGYHKTSYDGETFSAFEGIPFAKPPIGERRFEEPEPVEKWEGIWQGTKFYKCAQGDLLEGVLVISGDEDCLYLNIYVPRVHPNPDDKLEVILDIHGGGFSVGSGHWYGNPDYFMDYPELIFITCNYRLGILGFLSTEDDVIPGNNGLKDQVMALDWIQKNIASFGGNPDSVTIRGMSSGAVSVHFHYLSPMSKGLFHRGNSQSGCALNPWSVIRGSLVTAQALAAAVGCPEVSSELKECLKQRNHYQIIEKLNLFYELKDFPMIVFGPVVEKGSSRPFLSEEPYRLLKTGQINDVPWLASIVPQEGGFMIKDKKNGLEKFDANWEKVAPLVLFYNQTLSKEKWDNVGAKIKEYYLGKNETFTTDNFDKLVKLFSDRFIINDVMKSLQLTAEGLPTSNNYLYLMSYTRGDKNLISHADDEIYFYNIYPHIPMTPTVRKMIDFMITMLLSFAKTGKPSINGTTWEPVKPGRLNFLNISGINEEDMILQTGDNVWTSGDFWDTLELAEGENL